jgi:hypothetical protein
VWEKRSGATFEEEKTAFVHFTRTESRANEAPLIVKDQAIKPSKSIKLLGVIFDAQLRFRKQVQRTVSTGMQATLALSTMTALLPATAGQLFNATVVPVVDYASTVWAHASAAAPRAFNTIQKMGAKAVIGVFRTVAREVAEAEASLRPVKERHMAKAMRTWADLLTLPKEHPLQACRIRTHRRFASPLSRVKERANGVQTDGIETIAPYILPPWQARIRVES